MFINVHGSLLQSEKYPSLISVKAKNNTKGLEYILLYNSLVAYIFMCKLNPNNSLRDVCKLIVCMNSKPQNI